tara:strand:+ start:428 stop:1351 length:924 start_codon:yes stop_codon:yes gene_type:complete
MTDDYSNDDARASAGVSGDYCNLSIKVSRKDRVRWLCAAKESGTSLTAVIVDALNDFASMQRGNIAADGEWRPGPIAAESLGISIRALQHRAEKGLIERRKDGRHSFYWVPASDAASILGISERQLRRRASAGKVERRKTGGRAEYRVDWLPTNEAADALGISRKTIQRRARSGKIETRAGDLGCVEYQVQMGDRGSESGFVYVISGRNSCKIGFTSKDPKQRLAALQTGNPQQLRLAGYVPGCMGLESRAHSHFQQSRLEGEWFAVPPSDAVAWLYSQAKGTQGDNAGTVIDALRMAIDALTNHDA